MILNDFAADLRQLSVSSGKRKREAAEEIGVMPQYVSTLAKHRKILNSVFVRLVEAFGYDIQVQYIKRSTDKVDTACVQK